METRRKFFLDFLGAALPPWSISAADRSYSPLYVGTYTRGLSKGIYVARYYPGEGRITRPELAAELLNPSWLALHPGGRFLYAVSETGSFRGEKTGSVAAFEIDRATGKLIKLNEVPSRGTSPCHASADRTGQMLVVANYGTGNVASFPIRPDGSLGEATSVIQHSGSGPNPTRQQGPHAHQALFSPDNRLLFVPDLGIDRIMIYRANPAKASLQPNDPAFAPAPPGSGPRHMAFHPHQPYAYVLGELTSTLLVYRFTSSPGSLELLTTHSTLPADYPGRNTAAEVEVHPFGRFLYTSNRGHDSIAVWEIDHATGRVALLEHVPSQGKTPRNFKIDVHGRHLLVANQDTDNVTVFKIDSQTGRLSAAGWQVHVGTPVCLLFLD